MSFKRSDVIYISIWAQKHQAEKHLSPEEHLKRERGALLTSSGRATQSHPVQIRFQ